MKSRSLIILCRSLLSSLIVAASGRRRLPLRVKNNITLMNIRNKLGALSSLLVLGLSTAPSSALVIMISDLVPADSAGNIETFLSTNFTNVTE
ncbi:MAG: hypothetical protein OSB65_18745, partial [Roseibacillus sp.]|nr:hypothetical protein [Roseibacillus sp.]